MRTYQEVSDVVYRLHKLDKIMGLLNTILMDIGLMKKKGELWVEEKESLSYTEVKQFLSEKTEEIYGDLLFKANKTLAKLRDLNLNSKQVEDVDQIIVLKEASSSKDCSIDELTGLNPTSVRPDNVHQAITFNDTDSLCEEFHCHATSQSDVQCDYNCLHIIGQHEQQISDAGKTDHRKYLKECSRNPGHTKFIPVNAFGLYHLPEGHRDKDLYDLIKAAADLTVKVSVTMTSPHRPEFLPNTEIPYFLYNKRGGQHLRTGTGFINEIRRNTMGSCPCNTCKQTSQKNKVCCNITIWTATNLVFDDIEANNMLLTLFYDDQDGLEIELKVIAIESSHDVSRDICWIQFNTCGEIIVERLQRAITLFDDACTKVNKKYTQSKKMDKLMFIISHPHGCYKQVSIGHWNDKLKMGSGFKLTHTAGTCQGSAGARVHCVENDDYWVYCGRSKSGLQYSCC
ncbi:uncharacterized protein LOC106061590 isoform X2 [Biomphalaria glabrata]|nr:uncharacterized protein LOC106061590 isoform X2 [Biomphalaria glabrata]XP_055895917.1 uncharacterized protein LOC106061590 isoform X2 [Biomphalaria glabrata]